MKNFLLSLITVTILLLLCCSCAQKASEPENSAEPVVEKQFEDEEPTYSIYDLHKKYEFPYAEENGEMPSIYWELDRNSTVLGNRVCKELAENNWENITLEQGYSELFFDNGIYPTEEEYEQFICTIHGSVNNNIIEVYVILALSEDNRSGKINRIIYTGNGREWDPLFLFHGETEIVDAYTSDIWEIAYAY